VSQPIVAVPPRGRMLADALVHRSGVEAALADFGAAYAREGEGLDVCLADLDDTHLAVEGDAAPLLAVRRTALAWADAVQGHYNRLTCIDPLTGLGSIQHVQAQVAGLYRAAADGWLADADVARTHALVVIELPEVRGDVEPGFGRLEGMLRRATTAELIRDRLPSSSQVAELTADRLVALVRRAPTLHARLAAVVDVLDRRLRVSPSGGSCRGWVEALPPAPDAARDLLDELAR